MFKINLLFLLSFIFLSQTLIAKENIFNKGVDFKEGVVHYKVSGSESGSKTLYIREFGKTRVLYTNTKSNFLRKNKIIDNMTLITPKWTYEIDLKNNSTTKLPNLKYLLFKKFQTLSNKEKQKIKTNLKNRVKQTGQKIAGYNYTLEVQDGVTTYKAQDYDFILKTKADILGFHTKSVVTHIEKKPLDFKIFTLPENLKIISTSNEEKTLHKKADKIIKQLLSSKINAHHVSRKNQDDLQQIIQESIKTLDAL